MDPEGGNVMTGALGSDHGSVQVETVVIGAGQAGLASGYHLARRGRRFVILDAYERVGDNCRCHWDTLRLYSPARVAALPGMRFPAAPMSYPTKDQMADFLEAYASTSELPVRSGLRVSRVFREDGKYVVATGGPSFVCDNVVVASGTFGRTPYVPDFAGELDPGIVQLHSSAYKNPAQLQAGGVLVVGASHSGGDIAFEAGKAGYPTVLSGRIHGEVPFDIEGRPAHLVFPVLFFLAKHLLTIKTPLGRKIRPEVRARVVLAWALLRRAGVPVRLRVDARRWCRRSTTSGSLITRRPTAASKSRPACSGRSALATTPRRSASSAGCARSASSPATSRARVSAWPAGTSSCTSPICSARSAPTRQPVVTIHIALP